MAEVETVFERVSVIAYPSQDVSGSSDSDEEPLTRVVQDPDVFEAHQGLEDLDRVDSDEGASWF
jgi:hypothetical protein